MGVIQNVNYNIPQNRYSLEQLKSVSIQCPYCGEMIELVVDCSVEEQEYIEDCEVCCRPITITVSLAYGDIPQVVARRESE
jgi:PHP family Zn ribbon phosphoesterase